MRKKELRFIMTFNSTVEAMAAEAFFQEHHLPGRLIPVPGQVKAGCGLAWMAACGERAGLMDMVRLGAIGYEAEGEYLV